MSDIGPLLLPCMWMDLISNILKILYIYFREYSKMIECFYTLMPDIPDNNCGAGELSVSKNYLNVILEKYKHLNCPTIIRSPCEEEEDCVSV